MKSRGRIFICYRREGGAEMARLVHDHLRERGFQVFMDVEDLKSGQFNKSLLDEIEASTDVIVILSPGSLDRCFEEGDWLRWEIGHAIVCEKNVIPLLTRGFSWPARILPDDLKALPYYQAVEPSHNLFKASMDKLVTLLRAHPRRAIKRLAPMVALLATVLLVFAAAAWLHSQRTARHTDEARARGRELCFLQDDWKQGLSVLATQAGPLKEPAQAELEFPRSLDEAGLARLWLETAKEVEFPDRWHCYRRARFWFMNALARPAVRNKPNLATAIKIEMQRVPALDATIKLRGESKLGERVMLRQSLINWISLRGGEGFEIQGVTTNLGPFSLGPEKPRNKLFSAADVHALLPNGVDLTTAKIVHTKFTGPAAERASCELKSKENATLVLVGVSNPANLKGSAGITFDVFIRFGNGVQNTDADKPD